MRKLNIGCGKDIKPDHTNIDVKSFPGVDLVVDLNVAPWEHLSDGAYDFALAKDVVEHLDSFVAFFDELHRVLNKGGLAMISVPKPDSTDLWKDPTHRRGYTLENFEYITAMPAGKRTQYTDRLWEIVSGWETGWDTIVLLRKV